MKNLVFIFHGMGNDTEESMKKDYVEPIIKWAGEYGFKLPKGFGDKIIDLKPSDVYKTEEIKKDKSLIEKVVKNLDSKGESSSEGAEIYLIDYNHHFNELLGDWKNDIKRLRKILQTSEAYNTKDKKINLEDINSKVEKTDKYMDGTDKNFFWTHVGDVILYKFFREVRSKVVYNCLGEVTDALCKKLENHKKSELNIVFIAHSLGTAVASDVIDEFYDILKEGGKEIPKTPLVDSIHMFSDVSHLVRENPWNLSKKNFKYSESMARPYFPDEDIKTGCGRYYNYRHMLDVFALEPYKFNPGWEKKTKSYKCFDNLKHIRGEIIKKDIGKISVEKLEDLIKSILKNYTKEKLIEFGTKIHSFDHYISNPEVLEKLLDSMNTDFRDIDKAKKIFENKHQGIYLEENLLKKILSKELEGAGKLIKTKMTD